MPAKKKASKKKTATRKTRATAARKKAALRAEQNHDEEKGRAFQACGEKKSDQ